MTSVDHRNREVRDWIDSRREEIIALLCELIAIDSVTGKEGPIAEFCGHWLRDRGIEVILQEVKDRFNTIGVVGEGENTLIFSGHLDTVPPNRGAWTHGPWEPTVADDKVFGLGASDMHASTVAAYFASLYLRDRDLPGRLASVFTIEEETTGDGTRLFLDWAEKEGFLDFSKTQCVVMEPTGLDHVCLGNRGSSFVVLRVEGLGGHGSRPHLSKNPASKVAQVVQALPALEESWKERYSDPEFGSVTLTVTSVNAGDIERTNVIPSHAQAVIDCRLTPALWANGLSSFRKQFGSWLDQFSEDGFDISWKELYPREGHKLASDHPLAQNVLEAMREDVGIREAEFRYTPAGNDAVYFGLKGIPTVNKVGPGHPECAHRVDEYVTVENLLRGVELFIAIARRHFARD